MVEVGAVFIPQLVPERLRSVAVAADDAGLPQLWLWEDCFKLGGVAAATAALAWTTRLKVGVGIFPVPLRNVALTAMELSTLHRLFPGRALLGVGHGVQSWMEQVGARAESPMTLLSEYLVALQGLLAGERVSADGRYVTLDEVALDWPPPSPPDLLAAGEGPKTLRLSGALADGTILTGGTTPDEVRRARELVDAARAESGRDGRNPITAFLPVATGADAQQRLDHECELWGWSSSDGHGVAGDVAAVAEGLSPWIEAGVDVVVLQPTQDEPDAEGFVAFAAEVGRVVTA
ncbi:LLM class flavin-dependent oxidoreductase [Angustibacter luteus]|uniref:LLM class flavin-dependent oxidoreductase n=1 Tax=Angustibacter luteus TaxID=658456 RepID=A0ABW1JC68_9ACTN